MLVMLLESWNDIEATSCCPCALRLWIRHRRREDRHDGSQPRRHYRGSVSPAGRVPGTGHRVQRPPYHRGVRRDVPLFSRERGDRHRSDRPSYCRGSRQAIGHLLCGLCLCLMDAIDIRNPALAVARTANRNDIKRPGVITMVVLFGRHSAISTLDRTIKPFQFPATHSAGHLLMRSRSDRGCAVRATDTTKRTSVPSRQQAAERTYLHYAASLPSGIPSKSSGLVARKNLIHGFGMPNLEVLHCEIAPVERPQSSATADVPPRESMTWFAMFFVSIRPS